MSDSTPPRRYVGRSFRFILDQPEFSPVVAAPAASEAAPVLPLIVEASFYNVNPPRAVQVRLDLEGRSRRGDDDWVPFTNLGELTAQQRWAQAPLTTFYAKLNALEPLNLNSLYPQQPPPPPTNHPIIDV